MFERGNPYKYVDENGHVYWDKLGWAVLSNIAAIGTIGGGVTLMTGGVGGEIPSGGTSTVVVVLGGALTWKGFVDFGKSIADSYNAIIENDDYFAKSGGSTSSLIARDIYGAGAERFVNTFEIGMGIAYLKDTSFTGIAGTITTIKEGIDILTSANTHLNVGYYAVSSSQGQPVVIGMSKGFAEKYKEALAEQKKSSGSGGGGISNLNNNGGKGRSSYANIRRLLGQS
jgi:hypothetical protein